MSMCYKNDLYKYMSRIRFLYVRMIYRISNVTLLDVEWEGEEG